MPVAKEKDENWIWEAMVTNPDLVGGFNRLNTTIIKTCKGNVIAKEGADGLLGLSIIHDDYPEEGLGVVVKSHTVGIHKLHGMLQEEFWVF